MYITIHMSDGTKIIEQDDKIVFLYNVIAVDNKDNHLRHLNSSTLSCIESGYTFVNLEQIEFIRKAKDEEIEYAISHRG